MRIYVASSWRNAYQQDVVRMLRERRDEVYDFKHPSPSGSSFHWSEIDPEWKNWSISAYRSMLNHPIAERGFRCDKEALDWAEAVVLVLPCGRSSHLELGYAVGVGKRSYIYAPENTEPELMYKLAGSICLSMSELLEALT